MRYHRSPLGGLAVLLLFLGGLLGETPAEVNSARGQTRYVPVYSEIPYGDRDQTLDLTVTRNHQLRGLDHPRKRACLTAIHNFFLTRADGTTAAERFFGQKPRSMFAAILESVEIPPAPLSPPRRALG